jgi:multidrug resistance efflux pump
MVKEGDEPAAADGGKKSIADAIRKNPLLVDAVAILLIIGLAAGVYVYQDMQGKIYIENAQISAPVIAIGPSAPGTIEKFYVEEGDEVAQGQKLAMVGNQTVYARTSGFIVSIRNAPGQFVGVQDWVVKMIDPRSIRLVGRVQEDKGLKDIKPGQKVSFTADAFPSRTYTGSVESIGETAREADIVFSISDKREEHEFEVNAIFDTREYPELKNGMSARMWVYK